MKIKLHKRFRAVLSLLVTFMLLVSVIPLTVLPVQADTYFTVYFTFQIGNESTGSHKDATPHINGWGGGVDNFAYQELKPMTLISDSQSSTGYKIYSFTFESNQNPTGLIFAAGSNMGSDWHTPNIVDDNVQNGYLYYSKEWKNDAPVVASFPYSELTYSPVTTFSYDSTIKDLNVPTEGTFTAKTGRHYESATLFDYFSDYELKNGQKRTAISEMYSSWEDPYRRMPLLTFDTALSNYYNDNNVSRPLYFGDIHDESGGYYFSVYNNSQWHLRNNSSDVYRGLYNDNNSMRRSALDTTVKAISDVATTGLYKQTLEAYNSSNTNVQNAKRLKLQDGKDVKWFDDDWLASGNFYGKRIGASYDVDFPFWNEKARRTFSGTSKSNGKWAECNYFCINSELSDHALRLTKENGTDNYYLKETGQGIYNFSGNDYDVLHDKASTLTTTYGFFPFNDKTDFYTGGTISNSGKSGDVHKDLGGLMDYRLRFDRTNYNFGMYMAIPFKLTNNVGTVYGTTDPSIDAPITFTFSGDDDMLVYIDGNLVLDIGGAHGKVLGEINLYEKKSWVGQVKSTDNSTGNFLSTGEAAPNGTPDSDIVKGYFTRNATISDGLKNFTAVKTSGSGVKDLSSMTKPGTNTGICEAGEHVMEIFYVERGLFDSNMEIMYNLPVVDNRSFTVEQTITTSVNEIFTATNQSNSANNTAATNFNANVNNMKFEMDLQFSKPTDLNDFNTLLHSQGYYVGEGDASHSYQIKNGNGAYGTATTFTEKDTNSNSTNDTYTVKMGNTQMIKYQSGFIKPYSYNLKVSQGHLFIGNTDKGENTLFTTTWTLNKYGDTDNDENTGQGDGAGPVHTTSSSARPARKTKTTSTSANSDTSFDFRGTLDNPDAIAFYNTMQTAELTVTKTFNRKSGDTEAHTFEFTVTFDNVGGINLEEPGGVQATSNNVITTTVSVSYAANESGDKPVSITGIPVNTEYTVVENGENPTGYMTTYTNNINTTAGTIISTGNNAGVANSPSTAPEKIILNLVVELGSTDTLASANDLPAVKLSVQRRKGSDDWAELTQVTVPAATNTSPSAQQKYQISEYYSTNQEYKDKYDATTVYEYRILAYKSDNTTLITDSETAYGDTNGFIVWYNASGVPAHQKSGTAAVKNTVIDATYRVLEMGVKLTLPKQQQDTPETGGNGIYILTIGGFIAILLAGAGYFIYKKRIFA